MKKNRILRRLLIDKRRSFGEIATLFLTRRDALKGIGSAGLSAIAGGAMVSSCATRNPDIPDIGIRSEGSTPPLTFSEIPHLLDDTHHVAPGYEARVMVSWGDALFDTAPVFDANRQTATAQSLQFGFNNDFIAYFPLPETDDDSATDDVRGLLCVNHEYTNAYLMFPGYTNWKDSRAGLDREQMEVEIAAHGHSVLEVEKRDDSWHVVVGSPFNRRITMSTPMDISGPAAGHARLKTSADPSGRRVLGTMGNCAGGVTPWGTVLIAEENFRYNFGGHPDNISSEHPREARNYARFNFGDHERRQWFRYFRRFSIETEPTEANRFGWMVEFDPYDPLSVPKKRTALGRFQHEGCSVVAVEGKPLVAYCGDDGTNEYIYRFVSRDRYEAAAGHANSALFDVGTLYVARLHDDGRGEWLPLIFGRDGLTPENGFEDQGDVLIDTRIAADIIGATPMDRPEDIDTNPLTGRTYVSLTKNPERSNVDGANPRADNAWGHIVELLAPGADGDRDHTADEFTWDLFILAGEPDGVARGRYGEGTSDAGWFCNPDNIAFDHWGRIWIATDTASKFDFHDGLWAAETTGPRRAQTRHFFGCPRGAELCGPCFTPDGKTLFVAVQHPGDDGSTFLEPSTRWPDFRDDTPPRPSVVAITRRDGQLIGT